jgi:enoyl-CoA hydratase/carnithine racemase
MMSSIPAPCVLYQPDGRIARITLNRPEKLNAINDDMPQALSDAVARANADDTIHVIILSGAGRAFCSGYDLELYAETPRPCPGSQDMPWDPMIDFQLMYATLFDGMTRHSPEGVAFKARAEAVGFKKAVEERDSGERISKLFPGKPDS